MGLLKHLLFWPVTGPEFLAKFSLQKVHQVVREELTNDQPIKEELLELQLQLESGEIDDDEYVEREARLMAALRDVRHWREQFGMGISGGPVRVADSGAGSEPPGAAGGGRPEQPERKPDAVSAGEASFDIELNFDQD